MLSFWMTPMNSGKFSIQCMCLVLLAIFTVTVGNALPPTAEHVPHLGKSFCHYIAVLPVILGNMKL